MSEDESNLSKRQRQRQRRQQRQQEERAAQRRARQRRVVALALAGLLLVGAAGVLAQARLADRAGVDEARLAAEARFDAVGCTPIQEMPPQGREHLDPAPEALAAAPPEVLYVDRPTANGPHLGQVAVTGVYDEAVDERLTTHNLEHGYVVLWHDPGADPDAVDQLRAFAQEQIDGDHQKIIAAPYYEPLPEPHQFAMVAWDFRQLCEQFDPQVALNFVARHHGPSGRAPEGHLAPHLGGGPGEIDPDAVDGPLLFPPLDVGPAGVDEAEPEHDHHDD